MVNWLGLGWDVMVVTRGVVVERRGVMCVGLAGLREVLVGFGLALFNASIGDAFISRFRLIFVSIKV